MCRTLASTSIVRRKTHYDRCQRFTAKTHSIEAMVQHTITSKWHTTYLSVCEFTQHEAPSQPSLSLISVFMCLPCMNATMPHTARTNNACQPVRGAIVKEVEHLTCAIHFHHT